MLHKDVVKLLNEQVNAEFYSAYLYLDFSNYFSNLGLDGFANWYKVQAQEERDHAMMFYNYLHSNGEEVQLQAIDAPERNYKDTLGVLKEGLAHEQLVTSLINKIYKCAEKNNDLRTCQYLHWFIEEQAEEEETAEGLVNKFELFGDVPSVLYNMDQELATRTYVPPVKL